MFQLFRDRPHGVVSSEHDPLRAERADDVPRRVGVEFIEGRGRVDDDVVVLRQHFRRLFPDAPAAEVGADELQFREGLQHVLHAVRVGVVVAFVARMDVDGQAPVLAHREDVHGSRFIDLEVLDVRVELDAVEPEGFDLVKVRLLVLRVEVQGAEARESPAGSELLPGDVSVDAVHLVRGRGHRKDDVVVHACGRRALHQPVLCAVVSVKG